MSVEFQPGWWGTDLAQYRACSGTYELYRLDSLPPVPPSVGAGEFDWLGAKTDGTCTLTALADVPLPEAFRRFMGDPALQAEVPSCTACEWDLSEPLPSPVEPGGRLVRFLRDQQDCLFWYLYLPTDRDPYVVVSPIDFEGDDSVATADPDLILANVRRCAPDFETFVFHFWAENVLWFILSDGGDVPPILTDYLRFYQDRREPA
jgi:hypothetical protein